MARTARELAELKEHATTLREAGIGAKRIAVELGISHGLANKLLSGVPVPASLMRTRAKDDLREAAVLLRQQGCTYDEIKAELGVSKGSLSLWLRELAHPDEVQRADARQGGSEVALPDPPEDREVARALRRDGWLLREIAEELGIAAPTAWRWCAGIPVPPRATHGRDVTGMRLMREARWEAILAEREVERQAVMTHAATEVGQLSARELMLVAVTAYWCEGAKSKPWARCEFLKFINSDPDLIRLFLTWLRALGVPDSNLYLSVSIHETADTAAAEQYWSTVVGIPVERFNKPSLKRHNPKTVRKNTGTDYRGCLIIGVRQSRLIYQRVAGTWAGIATGSQGAEAAGRSDTA